jgi:type IV secretion system protein VirD4
LAQIKKLFKDGAWEGVVGNCDTFIYLGGNEQSSHKYVSELLGKWTIDKKTDGESKGTSGSVSKNYDVLGRDLIDSAEMRLLSNNKCIIFVRGEKPLMDDKWFPWSKKIIKEAEAEGKYSYNLEETYSSSDEYITGLNDKQLEHYLKISEKNNNIVLYDDLDPVSFMKMNIDDIFTDEISIDDIQEQLDQISEEKISEIQSEETAQMMEEELSEFLENYDRMSLLDIFKSPFFDSERKKCMKELSKLGLTEETIKDEASLDIPIAEVQRNVVLATEYYS